jgi:hypothetical protein
MEKTPLEAAFFAIRFDSHSVFVPAAIAADSIFLSGLL